MSLAQTANKWLRWLNSHPVLLGVLLFAIGLAVRFLFLALIRFKPTFEFAEMENMARSLAQHGVLGNPYKLPTGPSAHHAPVYPAILALIFKLFGYGSVAAWISVGLNLAFASLQYALLPWLAQVCGLPVSLGAVAGLVGALIPFRILKETRWEVSLVAAVFALITILLIKWAMTERRSVSQAVTLGLVSGAALLTAPALLPVFAAYAVLTMLFGKTRPRHSLSKPLIALACASLMAVPWIVRNYVELGSFVFVRSNFPLEFSISNHAGVYPLARDNYQIGYPDNYFHLRHPWSNAGEARKVQQLGELAYNRSRMTEAWTWCRTHWGEFLRLTFQRFMLFWTMPSIGQRYKDVLLQPLTVFGILGAVLMWRRRRQAGLVFAGILLGFPVVYYFVQIDSRYRYPIDWALTFLAVYFLYETVGKWLWNRSLARNASFHRG